MWAKLKLHFEELEEEEDRDGKPLLHQVLTLRRLQSLESLSLGYWGENPTNLLQTVADYCPNLRRLTVDFDMPELMRHKARLAEVAGSLVKFEQIDFTEGFILCDTKTSKAILMAILAVLPGEDSKLKVLILDGDENKLSTALAEAREAGVRVQMTKWEDDDDFSESDSDSNSEEDDLDGIMDDNSDIDDDENI